LNKVLGDRLRLPVELAPSSAAGRWGFETMNIDEVSPLLMLPIGRRQERGVIEARSHIHDDHRAISVPDEAQVRRRWQGIRRAVQGAGDASHAARRYWSA
jgi:hypothetical protein